MEIADFSTRFTAERERLGYSQLSYARALGISAEGLRKIEMGKSLCKADVLASAASIGADVQFILTGVRSLNTDDVAKKVDYSSNINIGNVVGIGHIASNSGMIQISPKNITKAITLPGEEHITVEQRAILKDLVDKIVETELTLKKAPKSHRAVWSSLNAHCRVNTYTLIAAGDFEKARKFLHQWLGRLNSSASAPVKDGDNWRKRHYAYIKINSKAPEDGKAVKEYMKRKYRTESLTELTNDQLDAVYKYVAGRRNRAK